jgi:DNA-binding NtrC family response regulator
MAKILLVEDERKLGIVLAGDLEDAGHSVLTVQDGRTAISLLKEQTYDIIVTDIRMEPVDGLELLAEAKRVAPDTDVVVMTAYASAETAIEALRHGAADYLTKPFPSDELVQVLARVSERQKLRLENRQLKRELASPASDMIAASSQMKHIVKLVDRVAPTDTTVLITGQSGTGKEIVAQTIHARSTRADGPFVAVNCAALAESLLESELFGHEKGAFTGADRRHLGRFEIADGGTLFLDEIGEIGQGVQVKLLRSLETKCFERVGGAESISSDVRIIAATNRDIDAAVAEGQFREDLLYRINVFPLEVPPLSERPEDVVAIAQHLIGPSGMTLSEGALDALQRYDWPGNVRELRNVLERSMIIADDEVITPTDLMIRPDKLSNGPRIASDNLDLAEHERQLIVEALNRSDGNKTEAARLLGISRRALYSRADILEIEL